MVDVQAVRAAMAAKKQLDAVASHNNFNLATLMPS
jgi:hypothetical protein